VIELQSIKTSATCQHAPAIAKKWLPEAQFEAIESDAEFWERWREDMVWNDGVASPGRRPTRGF
jgi:hypothetical protein